MFDECPGCGAFSTDKSVESGPVLVCPDCGHTESFSQLPLLIVSGAAATGKSTVLRHLTGTIRSGVLLDSDVLWREEFKDDTGGYFRTWLRLCRDISQSGRPPVLFGTGFGVPENVEQQPQRQCFSEIHYLILVCDDEVQRTRLLNRPKWRRPNQAELADQIEYNQWLKANTEQNGMSTIDTTNADVANTAENVHAWITSRLE